MRATLAVAVTRLGSYIFDFFFFFIGLRLNISSKSIREWDIEFLMCRCGEDRGAFRRKLRYPSYRVAVVSLDALDA